jgi:hypoxanthine-guanine phosphoribosyltransferase
VFIKALTAIMFILLAIVLCAIGTWLVNKEIVKENQDYRIKKTREKTFNTNVGSVCILVGVFIFLGNIVYIVMILG